MGLIVIILVIVIVSNRKKECFSSECYSKKDGTDYRGTLYVTKENKVCMMWNIQDKYNGNDGPYYKIWMIINQLNGLGINLEKVTIIVETGTTALMGVLMDKPFGVTHINKRRMITTDIGVNVI